MRKISKLFREYPGYTLNVIALLLSIIVIFSSQHITKNKLNAKNETLQMVVKNNLSNCISYSIKQNLNKQKDKQIINISYDKIREGIMQELLDDPSTFLLYMYQPEDISGIKIKQHEEVIKNINIRKVISEITPQNIDDKTDIICNKISQIIKDETPILKNKIIIYLWIGFALFYIIMVGLSYFGWNLEIEKGEPILNIIDVGLYLALIEYSGGFSSPIKWILIASIIIAILDFRRLISLITDRYNSFRIALYKWKDISTIFSTLSPTLLYLFVLSSGLIWATIGLKNHQHHLWDYWEEYFEYLVLVLAYGLVGHIVLYLFNKFKIYPLVK